MWSSYWAEKNIKNGLPVDKHIAGWLVVEEKPLWKIWVRQLGLLFPKYGKIKHLPNHQPVWWWLNGMFWGDFMEYIYIYIWLENPRTEWGLISLEKSPISMVLSCPFSSRPCLTTGEYLDSLNVSGYCGWLRNPAIDRGSTIQFRDIGKKKRSYLAICEQTETWVSRICFVLLLLAALLLRYAEDMGRSLNNVTRVLSQMQMLVF